MIEIRWGIYHIRHIKKMIEDNKDKVMVQEVEALELNKFMDIDLLDKKNTLEILHKEK